MSEQVLAKMANLLEERGWIQGQYHSQDGRLCLVGALSMSVAPISKVWYEVYQVIQKELDWSHAPLSAWNDEPGRTKEEVISTIRNAKRWL